jgi:hypothetical protein
MEKVQLFLTDDNMVEVRAMFNWRFWYDTVFCGIVALGFAIAFGVTRNLALLFLLIIFGTLTLVNLFPRMRAYRAFQRDVEMRLAESVTAAPQKVWRPKKFFCYVRINGNKIRVPWERYYELREANLVRIAYLPESRVAVQIEVAHGLGIGM